MKVISIQVGLPQVVMTKNENIVTTGIFKESIGERRVKVNQLNLEGDAQADLTVHGGWSKSVYVYPAEHYEFWRKELPDQELPYGVFGENLTVDGMIEKEIFIGDEIEIGTARFAVTEPRMPCYKLGIRFGRADIIKRFMQSLRSGFYLTVLRPGEIGAGDEIKFLRRDENHVSVTDIVRLITKEKNDSALIERTLRLETLPDHWKEEFAARLGNS